MKSQTWLHYVVTYSIAQDNYLEQGDKDRFWLNSKIIITEQ